ncbi:MAG: 30S ribosomal protein S9 [Acetobacter sp.]|nr:30S ribosomal protein S9 [Bacteroides sp.]MCM1342166.1 30S ribosomal protein S9 [Acetobacter sp.]MCM1433155.1 30S ribosomal protein S9 [Clostridiales bacterium]
MKNFYSEVNKTLPYNSTLFYYGTGRRKKAVARVRIYYGTGKIIINNRNIDDYFAMDSLKCLVKQPLVLSNNVNNFDIICNVKGGGVAGQASAVRLGISKALLIYNNALRAEFKSAGYLTRDSRIKERKKYGLKAARKAPQHSKR